MAFNLKNRHLLSLVHHSEHEINYLLSFGSVRRTESKEKTGYSA